MVTAIFSRLFRPVDGAWLAAFRGLFGLTMAVSMVRFLAYGWVTRFFVEPTFHFKYWGFSWVEPLSASAMTGLFVVLVLLACCMAVGFCFRFTATSFALGLSYIQLIDVSTYLNHYYLAALLCFLLAASPAGKFASVDAWLAARRKAKRPAGTAVTIERSTRPAIAAIWLHLFRFQVGVVYVFAGLAKLNADWLIHAQPLRIWLGAKTHLPILGPLFTVEGVPLAMSWAGFLFDTTIVLWLSWRRTRPYAYAVVLVFHTLTRVLFPIGMFPLIMSLAALVFFEPDWPRTAIAHVHAIVRRVGGSFARTLPAFASRPVTETVGETSRERASETPSRPFGVPRSSVLRAALLGAVGLYGLVQLALPLRYWAYGGNVMWHEQGMRFSWRVMLRAKGGSASFTAEQAGGGHRERVDPRRYLTDLQQAEMVSQPDLILQLAHHIRRDYERRGWSDVRVRVDSRVSLNGRRSAVLVDPGVDLASQQPTLLPFSWVTQAPSEPPHHTRPVL